MRLSTSTISKIDKILLIGIVLAPMTGLRIAKIGPSELLVFFWCFLNIKTIVKIKVGNFNFLFWFIFFILIVFGVSYGVVFYPDQVIVTDIFTWSYLMFVNLGIYQVFRNKGYNYSSNFLKKLVISGSIWYLFLYFYSLIVSGSFWGAPLWYGDFRFSGGATNPHQIAVLIGAFVPLTLKYIQSSTKKREKLFYLLAFSICIFLGYQTRSATLQLAIVLSLLILFLLKLGKVVHSKKNKVIVYCLITVMLTIIVYFNNEYIIGRTLVWIESDPNGLGRLSLFSSITDTLQKNFIFGLGPGIHAWEGTAEYHNTYLEILAMSGILGLVNFFIYSLKVFKIINIDIYFVSSVLALYFYGLAGFSMRRLVYWAIIAIILAIAEQLNARKNIY